MRYTEKELAQYGCRSTANMEGRLNYRPPSGNFSQSGFKERWFKLTANFLFYFRINESGSIDWKEPSGVFVLEHSQVQAEVTPGTSFAFSLAFQDEQSDRKHLFSARSEEQVQQWVTAIQSCSYEYWRSVLRTMQGKIKRLTGKDPLLMYPHNESIAFKDPLSSLSTLSVAPVRPSRSPSRRATSFKSHLKESDNSKSFQLVTVKPQSSFKCHVISGCDQLNPSLSPLPLSTAINEVSVPTPFRPNRSGNRKTQSITLQATREAPPPPSNAPTPRQSLPITDSIVENLIEF